MEKRAPLLELRQRLNSGKSTGLSKGARKPTAKQAPSLSSAPSRPTALERAKLLIAEKKRQKDEENEEEQTAVNVIPFSGANAAKVSTNKVSLSVIHFIP